MRMRSADESPATQPLVVILSVIAGSVDTIAFLRLNGLFAAHITGNLVILASKLLAGDAAPVSHIFSVPVFVAVLFLTRLIASGLDRLRIASLTPLLVLQFLLLSAVLAIGTEDSRVEPNSIEIIATGMLGVSAMAVQNALVRIALPGAPSTAVMTTNLTVFVIDIGDMLFARDLTILAKARRRATQTGRVIAGFLLGCVLGAAGEPLMGLRAFVLPAGLALVGVGLGLAVDQRPAFRSPTVHKECT